MPTGLSGEDLSKFVNENAEATLLLKFLLIYITTDNVHELKAQPTLVPTQILLNDHFLITVWCICMQTSHKFPCV